MRRKSTGMIYLGLIIVMVVCVKQTFAAALETIAPTNVDLDSDQPWVIYGNENGDNLGWSVSAAGDVNGDGFSDIIVGAPFYGPEQEGTAFVFYGREAGLNSIPDWTMGGGGKGVRFGNAVSGAGDVNGDGYDDVIIGAEDFKVDFEAQGEPKSGAVFVYYGSEDGLGDTQAWHVEAETREIQFGHAVSDAGDINGDGYADVIVGAPAYESNEESSSEGKAYLYLGSLAGLSTTPDWTYECNQVHSSCGKALGSAGDVDGDGFDDIIVGAPNFDGVHIHEGAAFVFHGNPTGLSTIPDWTIMGNQEGAELGSSVAGAGDVNDDGFADVIVGAPHYSSGEEIDVGAAFVHYGSSAGLSLTQDWESYGSELGSMYGASVNGAGDVDQDGSDDVIIGAPMYGDFGTLYNQPNEGAAYLYEGSPTGLEISPNWMASGGKAEAEFGFSVDAAGDINGDGRADVIVGAPLYKFDLRTVLGSAHVYYAQNGTSDYYIFIPHIFVQDGN